MVKKLLINLEKCYACKECTARCSYHYHPENKGMLRCIALAVQEHVCRRCDEPPCVKSCPQQALEKRPDGMLNRYSLRCTSCKSCTIACPFGVIIPAIVEYKTTMCDYSEGRVADKEPVCIASCPHKALEFVEVEEDPEKNIYAVRKGQFFVRTIKWQKEK